MGKIYLPEHFRSVTHTDIAEKLNLAWKLYTPLGMNLIPTQRVVGLHNHTTSFPWGHKLWNGKGIIVHETYVHMAQARDNSIQNDRFNRDTITEEITDIIGETPSMDVSYRKSGNRFLATYDHLSERSFNNVEFGDIDRTRIVIVPFTSLVV